MKIHGKYKKEDGKKIMRIINEIKVKGMQLARIVDENDMPIIPNIGLFASFDPVALDLACAEAVNAQTVNPGSKLDKANRPDLDNLTGSFPHTNWRSQITHAKKIGLGDDTYALVRI